MTYKFYRSIDLYRSTLLLATAALRQNQSKIVKEQSKKTEMHDEESQLFRAVDLDESSKTSHLVFSLERR